MESIEDSQEKKKEVEKVEVKPLKKELIKNKLDLISVKTPNSKPDELGNSKKVFYLNDYDDLSINFFNCPPDIQSKDDTELEIQNFLESYHMNQVVQSLK